MKKWIVLNQIHRWKLDNGWWISFIGQKLGNYGLTSSMNNELGNVDEVHPSWMKNECSCINLSMKNKLSYMTTYEILFCNWLYDNQ
jgi:hypothetical protein